MDNKYRTIEAILRKNPDVPGKAILIKGVNPPHYEVWVPRSLVHGGDMLKIEKSSKYGDVITFRMMGWKAEQLGLA